MLRIIVADDYRPVREALVRLLEREKDITVVGQAADGAEALSCVHSLAADILLLDLNMSEVHGFEVLAELQEKSQTRVIILSLDERPDTIRRALATGAAGYVTKRAALSELLPAIRAVAAGRRYLCTVARAKLAAE